MCCVGRQVGSHVVILCAEKASSNGEAPLSLSLKQLFILLLSSLSPPSLHITPASPTYNDFWNSHHVRMKRNKTQSSVSWISPHLQLAHVLMCD